VHLAKYTEAKQKNYQFLISVGVTAIFLSLTLSFPVFDDTISNNSQLK
jgi:hypothetical protein